MPRPAGERYVVRSVVRAAEVLEAFRSPADVLRLRDVQERTRLGKPTCFRLLKTLHHCGLLEKVDASGYRLPSEARRRRRCRIGYGAQGQDSSFSREVRAGLERAARREGVELLVLDNRYQASVALRNAERLVRERVDLAIEFQTDEAIAPAVASRYLEAGIPLVAIDIPHPGATYFGADNYRAGRLAGRHLGEWARARWQGKVGEVLLLELGRAGALVHGRVSGLLAGLGEVLRGTMKDCPVVSLDGDGQFHTALTKVRRHLRSSRARNVLVGAANDPSALGAARAFQEAGRAADCAVVGQNAEPDARAELRNPRSPLVGSVAYFPERYGDGLMELALDILARRPTAPAHFIRHQLVTADTVDHVYPNDALLRRRAPAGIVEGAPR